MNRTDLIKLLHAIYTSVDTGVEENWQMVQSLLVKACGRYNAAFLSNVNVKHYEDFNNFTELFNECFPDV